MGASAHLFAHGQAVYFVNGEQAPEYQIHGWLALAPFLEKFPNAEFQMLPLCRDGVLHLSEQFQDANNALKEAVQFFSLVPEWMYVHPQFSGISSIGPIEELVYTGDDSKWETLEIKRCPALAKYLQTL